MQIKWSKKAGRALDTALAQGIELFGTRSTTLFYNRVKSYEPLLASNPYMGKIEPLLAGRKRHQYRSLVVHEHFKLIYYIDQPNAILYIADLWDTRREPSRLAGEIGK